ncbi:DUF3046 domain-containing protein [Staphylococcus chromogenes]|nr:DUF3046 domain-containing protein [Staphylococcus chromogenes]
MRLAEFHRLVEGEFGKATGEYYLSSHVLSEAGSTPAELMQSGADLRDVWWMLCRDFDVPEERWLGEDI